MVRNAALFMLLLACVGLAATCAPSSQPEVVVYVSVDQHHAEPVLAHFEASRGIKVRALYDVEAAKTTGLVNRLIAERDNPQADVFWNGEFSQTIALAEQGVLAPHVSANQQGLPLGLVDPADRWAGSGGRARALIINTDLVAPEDYPTGINDLLGERWPAEKVGMARPLFGTTLTHAAALYALLGPERAREFFTSVHDRGVRIVDGNSVVRDLVEQGELMWGLTDTDDAAAALERGSPVAVVLTDQGEDGLGTLMIPTTVALVRDGPHPEPAAQLYDYLLSAEAEQLLVDSGWCQAPVHQSVAAPRGIDVADLRLLQADPVAVQGMLETAADDLREIFNQ